MAPLFRLLFSVSHALDSVCLDLCPPLLREGVCTSWAGLLGLGGGLRGGGGGAKRGEGGSARVVGRRVLVHSGLGRL